MHRTKDYQGQSQRLGKRRQTAGADSIGKTSIFFAMIAAAGSGVGAGEDTEVLVIAEVVDASRGTLTMAYSEK